MEGGMVRALSVDSSIQPLRKRPAQLRCSCTPRRGSKQEKRGVRGKLDSLLLVHLGHEVKGGRRNVGPGTSAAREERRGGGIETTPF